MKKLKVVLVCMLFITWISGITTASANAADNGIKSNKLVLGTSADYPPYEFHKKINGKDEIVGIDISIAKEVAKDMGVELQIEDMDFDSLLLALDAGKVDMVMAAMNATPERRKSVDFSNIYYQSEQAVLIRAADKDKFKTMDDLIGKHLGAQKSTIYEDLAKTIKDAKIESLAKVSDLTMALQANRIDAIIMEGPVAEGYVTNREGLAIADAKPAPADDGYAIAVKRGNTALVGHLNTTIDRLIKEDKIGGYVTEATKLQDTLDADTAQTADTAAADNTQVKNKQPNIFELFSQYKEYYFSGLGWTLLLSLITVFFGLILGVLLVLMRLSKIKPLKWIATAYIEIFRGTPLLVQLSIIYFGLPSIGIEFPKFLAGAIALSLNSAAYLAEIFRAGIQSIDKGQLEAARSLGMSQGLAMRLIVLPQALKRVLPAIGNEFVVVIKESSIVSFIGITDLMFQTGVVRGASFSALNALIIAAIFYFIITFVCSKLLGIAERRLTTSD